MKILTKAQIILLHAQLIKETGGNTLDFISDLPSLEYVDFIDVRLNRQ